MNSASLASHKFLKELRLSKSFLFGVWSCANGGMPFCCYFGLQFRDFELCQCCFGPSRESPHAARTAELTTSAVRVKELARGQVEVGIVLKWLYVGSPYYGLKYHTAPFTNFRHFENNNSGQLPYEWMGPGEACGSHYSEVLACECTKNNRFLA